MENMERLEIPTKDKEIVLQIVRQNSLILDKLLNPLALYKAKSERGE